MPHHVAIFVELQNDVVGCVAAAFIVANVAYPALK